MNKNSRSFVSFLCCMFLFFAIFAVPSQVSAKTGLSKTELTLSVGQTKPLRLNGTSGKTTYRSSKKSVVTVTSKGKITAKGKGSAVITAKNHGITYTCKVCVYNVSYSNQQVAAKAKKVIQQTIKGNMSDAKKIKTIHDYIISNCAYDYNSYLKNQIPDTSFTPAGVLLKKKAVCQGYAETTKLFMDSLGIPCKMVVGTGNGGGHAWNLVQVGKKWYHLDVTWDDPVPDVKDRLRYEYFLVKDSVMAEDHNWNKNAYPKCKSSSNSLISLFGTVTKNVSDASSVLASQYQNGNKKLTLILPTKASGADTFSMMSCLSDAAELLGMECHSCSYSYYIYGSYYIYNITTTFTPASSYEY